jgi:hypothetical protein
MEDRRGVVKHANISGSLVNHRSPTTGLPGLQRNRSLRLDATKQDVPRTETISRNSEAPTLRFSSVIARMPAQAASNCGTLGEPCLAGAPGLQGMSTSAASATSGSRRMWSTGLGRCGAGRELLRRHPAAGGGGRLRDAISLEIINPRGQRLRAPAERCVHRRFESVQRLVAGHDVFSSEDARRGRRGKLFTAWVKPPMPTRMSARCFASLRCSSRLFTQPRFRLPASEALYQRLCWLTHGGFPNRGGE